MSNKRPREEVNEGTAFVLVPDIDTFPLSPLRQPQPATIPLHNGVNFVGRSAMLQLDDARISRRHAEVFVEEGKVFWHLVGKNIGGATNSKSPLAEGGALWLLPSSHCYTLQRSKDSAAAGTVAAAATGAAAAAAMAGVGGSSSGGGAASSAEGAGAAVAAAAASAAAWNSVAEEFYCSICQDILVCCILTECGHAACKTCLTDWLKAHKDCPSCRATVRIKYCLPGRAMDNAVEKMVATGNMSPDDSREYLERKQQLQGGGAAAEPAGSGRRKTAPSPAKRRRSAATAAATGTGGASSRGSGVVSAARGRAPGGARAMGSTAPRGDCGAAAGGSGGTAAGRAGMRQGAPAVINIDGGSGGAESPARGGAASAPQVIEFIELSDDE